MPLVKYRPLIRQVQVHIHAITQEYYKQYFHVQDLLKLSQEEEEGRR